MFVLKQSYNWFSNTKFRCLLFFFLFNSFELEAPPVAVNGQSLQAGAAPGEPSLLPPQTHVQPARRGQAVRAQKPLRISVVLLSTELLFAFLSSLGAELKTREF